MKLQASHQNEELKRCIRKLGIDLGFQAVGFTDTKLDEQHANYREWIKRNFHGEMGYMERNLEKRLNPDLLVPDTLSVICVRLDYLTDQSDLPSRLDNDDKAYISRYALGRDYHKLMRKRLQKLSNNIAELIGDFGYRVFVDSAPVLEKSLAVKAGIGWQGKHSNVLHRDHGSWFFLGEIFTDLTFESDQPVESHCGSCTACIDVCPTQAIVAPYKVDARRCISYLTIELKTSIPEEFRSAIGNRIYGCDDCQIFCPWNKFAQLSSEGDFSARHQLDDASLLDCFQWNETTFHEKTNGSAIKRTGYNGWIRNLAVALGNSGYNPHIISALRKQRPIHNLMVQEHIDWAIKQQLEKSS
jgi:epoxyqueuosine reductase